MSKIVLDSSAVLAMAYGEPGGDKVRAAILSPLNSISISAVNWCEILVKLAQRSSIITAEKLSAILPGVLVVPFGQAEAEVVASLAKSCPNISLGDRACLALAKTNHATAWTADRVWVQIKLDVPVELIRN
jgi:PIN domain nuclease of toxin-antitoxin system